MYTFITMTDLENSDILNLGSKRSLRVFRVLEPYFEPSVYHRYLHKRIWCRRSKKNFFPLFDK